MVPESFSLTALCSQRRHEIVGLVLRTRPASAFPLASDRSVYLRKSGKNLDFWHELLVSAKPCSAAEVHNFASIAHSFPCAIFSECGNLFSYEDESSSYDGCADFKQDVVRPYCFRILLVSLHWCNLKSKCDLICPCFGQRGIFSPGSYLYARRLQLQRYHKMHSLIFSNIKYSCLFMGAKTEDCLIACSMFNVKPTKLDLVKRVKLLPFFYSCRAS